MSEDIVRASGIATYVYCRRAWWYLQQGTASLNWESIQAGKDDHRRRARWVAAGQQVWRLGMLLLFLAGLLLVIWALFPGMS